MKFTVLSVDQLQALSPRIINGIKSHWKSLGLQESLGTLADAANAAFCKLDAEFNESWAKYVQSLKPALDEADRHATESINNAKKVLRVKVSESWTPPWGEAGLPSNTTQTPSTMHARQILLESMAAFFAKHPEWESKTLGVTVALFQQRAAALKSALTAVDHHDSAHKQIVQERERAAARLRRRLRLIVNDVNEVLADDDPRWPAFGLDSPAAERATKPGREKKARDKAQSRATKRQEVARRKVEQARARAEKARIRAEKLQAKADKAKADAQASAAQTTSALEKFNALTATLAIASQPEQPETGDAESIRLAAA